MLNTIKINTNQMDTLERYYCDGYAFPNEIFYTPAFEDLHVLFDAGATTMNFYFKKEERGIRIWASVADPVDTPVPKAILGSGGVLKFERGSVNPEIDDDSCFPISEKTLCNDLFTLAFKMFLYVQDTALCGSAGKIEKGDIRIVKHYQCPCWAVRGHYRHYQNGKKIFVKPYKKGIDAKRHIKEQEYVLREKEAVPYVATK